ncbi:MAG TPA: hypothetical protein VIK18_07610 [Pirellulales bacterium]
MTEVRRLVCFARRRLMLQCWLRALPWGLSGGLLLACALLAMDTFLPLGAPAWLWPVAGAATGLATASVWTWRRRPSELEAAIEIDRRFGLKERVSSSYALDPAACDSPAGQALLQDARASLERLPLAGQFRLSPGRWLWLPVVPAAGALAVAFLLHPAVDAGRQAAAATPQQKQIERSTEALRKKLAGQRRQAQQQGLKAADELFARLEQGTRRLSEAQTADRKQALVKLNDLAKELSQRQADLAAGRKLANQLRQLQGLGQGPAEQLAKALEQGDLGRAARELQTLAEKLKRGELDDAGQRQLAGQLNQLAHKLAELAEAQRKLEQDLKQEIAEQRAAGRPAEADRLQQQLDQLDRQRQAQSLEKLAAKLGQCADCLQGKQSGQAASHLAELQDELNKLSTELAENKMLNQALDEIADAKDSMTCKGCGGAGCRECQGRGYGQKVGNGLGPGIGHGRGQGLAPDEKTDTSSYDTRVRQKVGRGAAVVTDLVTGPNTRGRVQQRIRDQWAGVAGEEADPLADQPLPAEYREHAKKYFDTLREGR